MATIAGSLQRSLESVRVSGARTKIILQFKEFTVMRSLLDNMSTWLQRYTTESVSLTPASVTEFTIAPLAALSATYDEIQLLSKVPLPFTIWRDVTVSVLAERSRSTVKADLVTQFSGAGKTVAIVDTGIDPDHPWLVDKIAGFYDVNDHNASANDPHGHGTHCAGIVVKVAPGARVYSVKVFDSSGQTDSSVIIKGIEYAAQLSGVQIVSMSIGGIECSDDGVNGPMSAAVNALVDGGKVACVAAGNEGQIPSLCDYTNVPSHVTSPGRAQKAITVGAVDHTGAVAGFSSYDESGQFGKPSIAAPGVGIISAKAGGGTVAHDGTSMATPVVAAVCAIVLQAHPLYTPDQVYTALLENAADLSAGSKYVGAGLADAQASVAPTIVRVIEYPTAPDMGNNSQIAAVGGALAVAGAVGVTLGVYLWQRSKQ